MTDPTTPAVQSFTAGRMSEADFLAACELHHAAFPKPGRGLDEVIAKKRPVWMDAGRSGAANPDTAAATPPPVRYAVVEGGRWLANAASLVRTVGTEAGDLTVCGLFDVATHPNARGRGLAVAVTQAVFNAVNDGTYPFCMFQTGAARKFYETKFGATLVTNEIVNTHAAGDPEANPFTDEFVMRYPGEPASGGTPWPAGRIDLRGPGF